MENSNNRYKFRAWDDDEGKMMETFELFESTKYHHCPYNQEVNPQLSTLMQYTGLKDKNGKEIYEGDIVKGGVYYGWENEKGKGIVRFGEWSQDASGGEYGGANCSGWYLELLEQEYGDFDNAVSLVNEPQKHKVLEVIGNIYENPELLTN